MTIITFNWDKQTEIAINIMLLPIPETIELHGEEAWEQWDLAIKLQDYEN